MIDIYNQPAKTVTVLCHTSLGDILDEHGRFYLKGTEYKLSTEIVTPRQDTKWEDCILCWINQTEGYGSRFAVKGNIYDTFGDFRQRFEREKKQMEDSGEFGEPYWPHFTDYFVCPIQRERDNKLTEIGIQ